MKHASFQKVETVFASDLHCKEVVHPVGSCRFSFTSGYHIQFLLVIDFSDRRARKSDGASASERDGIRRVGWHT